MQPDRTLRRLQESGASHEVLRLVARELGDELPHRRLSVLRQVREALAHGAPKGDAWSHGYRAALADVIAAYDQSVSAAREEIEAEELAKERRWVDVLVAIDRAPATQREIAQAVGMDQAQVSRILAEIRAAGFAEVRQTTAADSRARPHRLTLRGVHLLERLRSKPKLSAESSAVVDFVVGQMARLRVTGVMHREVAAAEARGKLDVHGLDPASVVERLAAACQRAGLAEVLPKGLVVRDAMGPSMVNILLEQSLDVKGQPAFWPAVEKAVGGPKVTYVVRPSGLTASKWDRFLLTRDKSGRKPAWIGRASRTVQDLDSIVQLSGPYAVVYDDPALLTLDRALDGNTCDILQRRARATVCLVAKGVEMPPSVVQIPVERYLRAA